MLLSRADTDPPPNGLKAGTRSITLVLGGFGKRQLPLIFHLKLSDLASCDIF